jgi:hypothetical protein
MNDEEQASFEKDRAHLPKKLTGAQAWYGPDMLSSKKWIYSLSDQDIDEINIALKTTENSDIAAITKEDFQLPNLSKKLREIQNEVINGRGFALIRGLPVANWSIKQSATAYYGIGMHIGKARSQNAMGHILGHVRDLGRDAVNDKMHEFIRRGKGRIFTQTLVMLCHFYVLKHLKQVVPLHWSVQ